MFIDCTGPTISVDPRSNPHHYPTGLVVQLLSVQAPGRARVGGIETEVGIHLTPKAQGEWTLSGARHAWHTYSLTEYPDHTTFEETGGESFTISGYYLEAADNNLVPRTFTLSVVEIPGEGWVVEIQDEGDFTVRLPIPDFNPRAVISLTDGPPVQEQPQERQAGKPIWERLNEDD